MSASALSLIFQSATALAVFLVLFLVVRVHQRVDFFRQRLFSVRDELFDFAAAGHIDFQDPAYQLLRNSMNGFIRYAHRLTFFQVILTVVRWAVTEQVYPLTWHTRWTEALEPLPEHVQVAMKGFHGRAMDAVARHVVGGSFVMVILLALTVLVTLLKVFIGGAWTSIRMTLRDAAEQVVTRIVDPRVLEEEASRA